MTQPLDSKPCGRLDLNPHQSHRYMQNAKVWQCPGAIDGAAEHPVRHTVDTITSDALDQLYARIDTLTAVCRSNQRAYISAVEDVQAAEQRARQAEAAITRARAELEAIEREAQAMNPYDRDPVAELDRIRATLTGPKEPPVTKPPAPNDWNGAWPRITVDPTDPDTACVLKLAVRGADRWLLGPQGPFHREGMALATITGEAVRQGLLHLLELGLIDIDRERLHGAGSFPLHQDIPDA